MNKAQLNESKKLVASFLGQKSSQYKDPSMTVKSTKQQKTKISITD